MNSHSKMNLFYDVFTNFIMYYKKFRSNLNLNECNYNVTENVRYKIVYDSMDF
jgi:hypothetical protein